MDTSTRKPQDSNSSSSGNFQNIPSSNAKPKFESSGSKGNSMGTQANSDGEQQKVVVSSIKTVSGPQQTQDLVRSPIVAADTPHVVSVTTGADQKGQQHDTQLENVTTDTQKQQQTSADFKDTTLANVAVEETGNPEVKVKPQEIDNSPDPQKQDPNKGHYETKPSGLLMWGFILCCCVLSAPLGGGFAFVLVPAQFASFGLVVFSKKGKKKVWKLDKKSMPEDKLVTQQNLEKMVTAAENNTPDNILTPVPEGQVDKLLAEMVQGLPQEQQEKARADLSAFAAAIQALAISNGISAEDAQELTSFMDSPEKSAAIFKSLSDSGIAKNMKSFISATGDEEKHTAAEQLVKSLEKVVSEVIPGTKEFPAKELLERLKGIDPEKTKEMIDNLAKSHDLVKDNVSPLLKFGDPNQAVSKSYPSGGNKQAVDKNQSALSI